MVWVIVIIFILLLVLIYTINSLSDKIVDLEFRIEDLEDKINQHEKHEQNTY